MLTGNKACENFKHQKVALLKCKCEKEKLYFEHLDIITKTSKDIFLSKSFRSKI